jgi:translation elongation factor EF-1alpha
VGQGVIVLPQNKQGVVEAIKDSEADFKEARAGQNVGIRVVGKNLESVSLSRGTAVVAYQSPLKVDQVLVGDIFWLEKPSQEKLILECGTAKTAGFLQEVDLVRQGKKSSYKILLEKPTVFDPTGNTIFGKIVLKDKGKIIGVGNVL